MTKPQNIQRLPFSLSNDYLQCLQVRNLTAASTFTLPIGATIQRFSFNNNTANAVTGGLKIGTTSGATDVVAAQAVAGSAYISTTDAATLKHEFSSTATTQLFIDAVASWNSAAVDVYVYYYRLPIPNNN